jgi:hypothetical protein
MSVFQRKNNNHFKETVRLSSVNELAKIDSEELRNFVSSTIKSIEEGLKGEKYRLSGCIEFELAVVNVKKGEGGLRLFVVDASGKYGKEDVSKIRFKIKRDIGIAGRFG